MRFEQLTGILVEFSWYAVRNGRRVTAIVTQQTSTDEMRKCGYGYVASRIERGEERITLEYDPTDVPNPGIATWKAIR
jgi:uncharacterized protein (UPF0548 family)